MNDAVIYGTDNCSYCQMAKTLCENHSIPYEYIDMTTDTKALNELIDEIGPFRTVPQIFVDGHYVGGFDEFKKVVNGNTN